MKLNLLYGAPLMVALLGDVAPLAAQKVSAKRVAESRMLTTVVLADNLPKLKRPYDAVILRSVKPSELDVIVLPAKGASAKLLDAATRALIASRIAHGLRPATIRGKKPTTLAIGVRLNDAPAKWNAANAAGAERILSQLRASAKTNVPGVGMARATTFFPPRPNLPTGRGNAAKR